MILTIHYQLVKLLRGWTQDFHVTFGIDRSKPAPWYYLDPETGIMRTGWQYLGNNWYYFRSSGAMATGWYQEGLTWYYLDQSNGDICKRVGNILVTSGTISVHQELWQLAGSRSGSKWYYAYSSGALAVNTNVDGYSVNYNGEWVR